MTTDPQLEQLAAFVASHEMPASVGIPSLAAASGRSSVTEMSQWAAGFTGCLRLLLMAPELVGPYAVAVVAEENAALGNGFATTAEAIARDHARAIRVILNVLQAREGNHDAV
jgi:hypothetical protein